MQPLDGSPGVPARLAVEYGDWVWEVAYQYGPAGLTYRLSHDIEGVRFLKLAYRGVVPSLEAEAARMRWSRAHLPVPAVIEQNADGQVSWLLTEGLTGNDATDPAWLEQPEILVPRLAAALRLFHGAPVDLCPFDFGLDRAIALVHSRLASGEIQPDRDFHPEHAHLSAKAAVERLVGTRPDGENLVVCHGDYCPPNIVLNEADISGFVDLGELGVADRWWDLAVATWSVTWNLGDGYEDLFLEEYGVKRDEKRLKFYRLLYDLVS